MRSKNTVGELFVPRSVDGQPCNVAIVMKACSGFLPGQIIRRGDRSDPPNCDLKELDFVRWGVVDSTRTFEEICAGPPKG